MHNPVAMPLTAASGMISGFVSMIENYLFLFGKFKDGPSQGPKEKS